MLDGPDDTTCIALLAELANRPDGLLDLRDLRERRTDIRTGIDALLAMDADSVTGLEQIGRHLLYDPSSGRLLIEDPQLMFYLRQRTIEQLAVAVGKRLPVVRDQVFVSYSHNDKEWLERLKVHLRPLVRGGKVDLWSDTRLRPGDRWHEEIALAINRAKAAILLIEC